MHYYLEDFTVNAILLTTPNILLMNNLMSGVLDCQRHTLLSSNTITIDKLEEHGNCSTSDTGIKFSPNGLIEFSLDDYPEVRKKQELIKIRRPAFELLLQCSERARSNNRYGFVMGEEVYIKHALSNPNAIAEYAQVMGMSAEFAKEELSMIVDSIFLDNFRIFTVCNMWKEKINKCQTVDEVTSLLKPISDTFWMAGIPHV